VIMRFSRDGCRGGERDFSEDPLSEIPSGPTLSTCATVDSLVMTFGISVMMKIGRGFLPQSNLTSPLARRR
jgi:hypothetical protein